jgi:hypothetical protein
MGIGPGWGWGWALGAGNSLAKLARQIPPPNSLSLVLNHWSNTYFILAHDLSD